MSKGRDVGQHRRNAVLAASLEKSCKVSDQVIRAVIPCGLVAALITRGLVATCVAALIACRLVAARVAALVACRLVATRRCHGRRLRRRHHVRITSTVRHEVVAPHVSRVRCELRCGGVDFPGVVRLQTLDQCVRRRARRAI